MKMQQTVPKCSPLEDVSRDETKLVFPFAIDVTPHTDSKITGGVKEDEDKLNESKPIDNKAKDVITLTLLQKWGMTTILAVIGSCFLAAYIFLIVYAANQVRSASNSPKSHLGGYSTSDYGWDISSFRNVDFVSQPRALSGRYSTGKNVKTTSLFRLEVSFNTITPQASGGAVSITLRMIVPESWKDESKPPKPWFTITCQFGNAVISVGPNSSPSAYDQIFSNFRLDTGSYNAYPFDAYAADATAWCYYDATAVNAMAPQAPTKQPVAVPVPSHAPTATACLLVRHNTTDPCCTNLYTYDDPHYGTYIEDTVLYSNQFHMFGCCSALSACCGPATQNGQDDDAQTPQANGPLSAACISATTTVDTPSACDVNISSYTRENCAMSLYRPSNARKLLEYPVGIDSYDPFNTRQLASKKYTSVIPTFGPPQGYLNFEVAIEKSDSGFFQHSQDYSGIKIEVQSDTYTPGVGQAAVLVVYDVITFPVVTFTFLRAPINKVFAIFLMIALWMIVASHTAINFTFYTGLKKVDAPAIVTGAVTILFALPAVRNTMPGAPPLGAVMDFAVYFWCIIISVMHILYISGLWMDLTYINPVKKEEKPQKVIIVDDPKKLEATTGK